MQMITPICKLVQMIGLSARSMNLAGKNLPKTIKGNYVTSLLWIVFFCACYYWIRVYLILIVTFPCDVITAHVVYPCMPPLSSPPVSRTQYRFPLRCHNVNKQWISGTGCSEEQCQMYGPQEIQLSQECNQFTGDGWQEGGERISEGIAGEQDRANQRQRRYGWRERTWGEGAILQESKKSERVSRAGRLLLFPCFLSLTITGTHVPRHRTSILHPCHSLPLCDWALAAYYLGS